jgi:hypothetical protein
MKTIYLHIGTHKTGTTSIQHFLASNRVLLQDVGVSYPNVRIVEKAHHVLAGQLIHDAGLTIFNKTGEIADIDTIDMDSWHELKQHIERTDYQHIVISSEEFEWLTVPSIIPELIGEEFHFKIIVFVRRQDQYLESIYQQFIKDSATRLSLPIEDWCRNVLNNKRYHDYSILVDRWGEVFGDDSLHVINFDDAVRDGIERTFLSVIGIDREAAENFKVPEKTWLQRQKEGLDVGCVEFLRWSNMLDMTAEKHDSILNALMEVSDRFKEKGEFEQHFLTAETRMLIMESVRDSNEKLRKKYFPDRVQMFEEPTERGEGVNLAIKRIVPYLMEHWKV